MASINNPTAVTAVSARGAAGQREAIGAAGALAREIEVQPTGPQTAQVQQPQSGFDVMAHRYRATDPAADEAWRDTVSLQPHFGQDQLMGAKPYDEGMVEYLNSKRNQAVQRKFDDLVLSAFDPLDPSQRQTLETMMPGLAQSKLQVFQMVQEQKEFIARCAIRAGNQLSAQEWGRLVRILGAGEPILSHPIDEALNGNPEGGEGSLGSGLRGIFSFLSAMPGDRTKSSYPASGEDTQPKRIAIAKLCLQHFPRYLTGAYDSIADNKVSRERVTNASRQFVLQCEAFVGQMTPLGNFVESLQREAVGNATVPSVNRRKIDGMFVSDPRANNRQ